MRILTYILSLIPVAILAYEKVWSVLTGYLIIAVIALILQRLNHNNSNEYIMRDKRK